MTQLPLSPMAFLYLLTDSSSFCCELFTFCLQGQDFKKKFIFLFYICVYTVTLLRHT